MLKELLFVGIGGGLGSIFRFLTSKWTLKLYYGVFPLPTFIVNILGCLFIGILISLFSHYLNWNQQLKLLLITGFCGGFTTFSTFSLENIQLFQTGHFKIAVLYALLSLIFGLLAVWLGLKIVR